MRYAVFTRGGVWLGDFHSDSTDLEQVLDEVMEDEPEAARVMLAGEDSEDPEELDL